MNVGLRGEFQMLDVTLGVMKFKCDPKSRAWIPSPRMIQHRDNIQVQTLEHSTVWRGGGNSQGNGEEGW